MSKKRKSHKAHNDVLVPDGWGEVETISKTCYQRMSVCAIVIPVTELFQKKPELVKDHVDVSKACLALINDIPDLRNELDAITRRHEKKKGDISETDDFLASIEIGQMYSTWLDRFERLVDPNLNIVAQYVDSFKEEVSNGGQ